MKTVEENSSDWSHNDRKTCVSCQFILDYSLIIWLISYYHCIIIPHFVNILSVNVVHSPFVFLFYFIYCNVSCLFHFHSLRPKIIIFFVLLIILFCRVESEHFFPHTKHEKCLQWITSIACFIVTTFGAWIPFYSNYAYFGLQKDVFSKRWADGY